MDRGKRRRALAEGDKVTAVGRTRDDTRHDALVVRHLAQRKPQLLAVDRLVDKLLHGGKPLPDFCGTEQGTLHPRPEEPSAHRGFCLIENAKKAPLLLLRAHRLGELQVPPGRQV